jgi:AraC-like DNA-binding protein
MILLLERAREDLRTEAHNSRAEQKYDECRRYLTDNYLRIRSLSDAAHACGLSAVHLSRLFRRFASESPHVFLSRMKMNHAAELIARNNLSVKSAAAEVGFEDPYHFSRVFKRVHGVAPSRFGT